MNLERHPTSTDVAARAADLLGGLLAEKPEATLILPAGRTPVPLYREWVRRARESTLALGLTRLFQLDEMVGVEPGDERSFHRFLREHLLDPIGRGGDGVHLLDGTSADPDAEIEAHSEALSLAGGADMAFLGIGQNGHVAFNEPGSRLDQGARRVELDPMTVDSLREMFPEGRAPTSGLTLGLAELAESRSVVLIATGPRKAEIVAEIARGEPNPERPASLLNGHGNFHVLVDRDAARLLDGP